MNQILETTAYRGRYLGVVYLYVIEERILEQVQHSFAQREPPYRLNQSIDQWKRWLDEHGISKNLSKDEVVFVKAFRNQFAVPQGTWNWLVFGSGILLDNIKLEERFAELEATPLDAQYEIPRPVMFIYLPFNFTLLDDPAIFRNFRRFLFFTRVHFDTSFDRGSWAPDERGLYARTPELRAGLSWLSDLHNEVVAALKQFKHGTPSRGRAILRDAFGHNDFIVNTSHHRQLPDILAVLLLILRGGFTDIYLWLISDLIRLARRHLSQNDPRRVMFEFLRTLPRGPDAHVHLGQLYFAFDAYCRYLWMSRIGSQDSRAYMSYNQASFPRADAGAFYDFFEGKDLATINAILASADAQLGLRSHETFLLWHTTLRFLLAETRSPEMVRLAQRFCVRLLEFTTQWDNTRQRQLNLDAALSFYLLGQAHASNGDPRSAFDAFDKPVNVRNHVVADDRRDTSREAALERMRELVTEIGNIGSATEYQLRIERTYSDMDVGGQ
ncbi:hypothetical protein BJY01DRAFT_254636 [Aspergillus pseudoustus]|uniref:Uncharacterized protein n=1 Tax=Aspergillus pseudoustus TaxID=1810923 RepID=A0ABR4IRM2_9EURO